MVLTLLELKHSFKDETLAKCFYIQQSQLKIRALNTRPQNAHIQALYPNLKQYIQALALYTNTTAKIMDTINSVYLKNYKIDILLGIEDIVALAEDKTLLALLPKEIQDYTTSYSSQIGQELPPVPTPTPTATKQSIVNASK